MQKQLYTGLMLALGLTITACEKVIDIPLEDADRKVVVEAVFRDHAGDNYVLLSKTGSVYDQSNFEKISGATVTITDQSGTEFVLDEVTGVPGMYNHATFQVAANNQYTLSVTTGAETFTSMVNTYYKPELDSLTYQEQIGTFGFGTDTTYLVFFNFLDNESQDNFYRINASVNGAYDQNLYVTNDELFNGKTYTQPIFATTVEKGDTVLIELLSMDKSTYTYFFSLPSANAEGPFAPTPANPVSNMEGGAIGYFAAYTSDTLSIIMPE